MKNVDFYLHFNGNSELAMYHYKKVFGGEFLSVQRYGDIPGSEHMSFDDKEKMVHISLKISEQTTLMASDVIGKGDPAAESALFGNNYHICLQTEGEKEADRLFAALSDEGKIEMPMNKTFWGAYFGMCMDKFGVYWMISFMNPQN